jgi:hypothetical protein
VLKNLATIEPMKVLVPALAAVLACAALPACAQTAPPGSTVLSSSAAVPAGSAQWRVMASPYTFHYSRDPKHRPVWMLGMERQRADDLLWGVCYFSNSFGQPSGFLYGGQRLYDFSAYPQLFAQWSAGLMYGYKGEYQDKVPFNHRGFSPGLVLAIGWQFTPRYSAQVNVLGNSAAMLQVSMDFR